MVVASNSKRRLYRSTKISDYRFRRVLDSFARDDSASDAARATGLSVNSVHALYRKLRIFFFECGLFLDFYDGHDPESFDSGNPHFEKALLEFHLRRYGDKHGFRSPGSEPHYHFAESCWRFDYYMMELERPSGDVHAMKLAHLLELIRLCGPVGAAPRNRQAGLRAVLRHADQRIEWLRRNAPGFRAHRDDLAEAIAITIDDRVVRA